MTKKNSEFQFINNFIKSDKKKPNRVVLQKVKKKINLKNNDLSHISLKSKDLD